MTTFSYDGKKIIPAPRLSLSKVILRTADGEKLGAYWEGSIVGELVAFAGSPDSDGDFWTNTGYPANENIVTNGRLGSLLRKQEALRELFSDDYHSLEVQSADGSPPMKMNPRITGINFPDGQWFNTTPYTINFVADFIYINGIPDGEDGEEYVSDASESWSVETDESLLEGAGLRTYRLTHSVSATGRRIVDENGDLLSGLLPYQWAKRYVSSRLGIDYTIPFSGNLNIPDYFSGYNHARNENIDELAGNYSVQESWILASGTAVEEFSVSSRTSALDNAVSVTVDGTITGFEQRTANLGLVTTKFSNAETKFAQVSGIILTRAQTYIGTTLNILPLSTTIGRNPYVGTISYNYEYDNRPSNIITEALSESISVQDRNNEDVIATIPIPGRQAGPILQNINTKQEKTRSLSVELVMPFPTGSVSDRLSQKPDVSSISDGVRPDAQQVYQIENGESWDIKTGRYSLNRTWIYE